MSDASILKEFLVALGFKVDEGGLKKFQQGIDKATKFAGGLATTAEAMAVAVEAAVTKVSAKFEDLYYASQRIGDSVENIRGFDFAIGQMGGTAQGARQALENMGEFFRSNPGAERFLQGLGVQTRTANGEMRQMTGIVGDLAGRLRAMPYYRAKVVAGVLGIDPRTLQALLRDTGEAQARFHDLARRMGVDQDAAAKASHDFMNDLRELLAVVTLSVDRIILRVQPFAGRFIRWLEQLDQSTGGWSTTLIGLAAVLGPLLLLLDPIVVAVGLLAAGIVWVVAKFSDWRTGLGQVSGGLADIWDAIQPVVLAIEGLAIVIWKTLGPAIGPYLNAGFRNLANLLHLTADVIRVVIDLVTGQWAKAWRDSGKLGADAMKFVNDAASGLLKTIAAVVTGAKEAWRWLNHGDMAPPAAAAAPQAPAAPPANDNPAGGRTPRGIRNNNPGNLRSGPGGSFGHYATPMAGLVAMAKNLQAYSRRGLNTVASIINRWAPSNENDTAAYIRDVARELHVGAREQLNLKDPATLQRLMGAIVSHENGRNPYSATLMGAAAAQALRGGGVQMSQKTDIHVYGGGDPHATGRAVAGEQRQVNSDMVRGLKSAAS